jgi:hypothetical protein
MSASPPMSHKRFWFRLAIIFAVCMILAQGILVCGVGHGITFSGARRVLASGIRALQHRYNQGNAEKKTPYCMASDRQSGLRMTLDIIINLPPGATCPWGPIWGSGGHRPGARQRGGHVASATQTPPLPAPRRTTCFTILFMSPPHTHP